MPQITRFAVRSSGRDLSAVRRPGTAIVVTDPVRTAKVKVEKPKPAPRSNPEPKTPSRKPESNSGDVKVEKPDA